VNIMVAANVTGTWPVCVHLRVYQILCKYKLS